MKLPSITHILLRVSPLDILFFTKHLSVMLKSGIPLAESITTLKDQTKNITFKEILGKIQADVENGQTLESSLAKQKSVFSSLYISLIGIGEKSGSLEVTLEYLAQQLKKSYDFNKKIQGAILYPKLILAATVIMGMFMSLFVLPKLVDLFNSLEVELPLSTKILLYIANLMKGYGTIIVAAFFGSAVLVSFLLRTSFIKPKWHKMLVSLPLIGSLNQNIEMASFCRNMGVMLKSGLTITDSLRTQFNATDNLIYKSYFGNLLKTMEKGKKLSTELSSNKYPFIPTIVPKMIGVGEDTGKLEDVFIYMGDFFEDDVDDTTRNLSNVLEPVLLLVIGVAVALVSLAIISPIYQLTGGIRR
ncbi:hypothetical protein A2867_05410 [Candidatus Daviesbacteria bacterium RIFCSPHIGHO2_01_FULL_40_11]|uniref:Type II secretion system protein GspF domain-containing protein n=1 Tax=Candidatus Daviesbacteria bacterium RIFCSPHIGHO2_01_FULL_40_11 TaxID=1797762 RepID=A0A1F5JL14_9BACT|nr:MAG: hypothetical protein A2867_05410 [Candidatus Daviesbacteria bacterium RIFCSPHIGHO2_01_FULL_40_11]OGE63132.1 MAG: hypothetical protein A2964_00825 [Candidatus Daviesbacteria bacterium RIFCSPLOWO2_01_FULL_40_27]